MAKPTRYDPELDELLQRTQAAIRHSQELIAKALELQRQSDRLRDGSGLNQPDFPTGFSLTSR